MSSETNSVIESQKIEIEKKKLRIEKCKFWVGGVVIVIFGIIVNYRINEINKNQKDIEIANTKISAETNIAHKYIETAISILKENPVSPSGRTMRDWAIDCFTKYSPIPITEEMKNDLRGAPIYGTWCADGTYSSNGYCNCNDNK